LQLATAVAVGVATTVAAAVAVGVGRIVAAGVAVATGEGEDTGVASGLDGLGGDKTLPYSG